MYRYWECPRCHARTATQSQVEGAYASPACQNATCHRATMQLIGSGVAPVAPPPLPGPVAGPAVLPGEVEVYAGNGIHHGRILDWRVYRNEADAEVRIAWTVGGSNPREARMHISMLARAGVIQKSWGVLPPFRQAGTSPACWLSMPSRSDRLEWLGAFHTLPDNLAPPATFDIRMCLGNAKFGLIHVLAGHVDDMRRWTSGVANVQGEAMQAYRTILGLHRGLTELLSLSALQEIRRDDGDKWIFVGADDACLVCTRAPNAAYLTVTTLYRREGSPKGKPYWTRRSHR